MHVHEKFRYFCGYFPYFVGLQRWKLHFKFSFVESREPFWFCAAKKVESADSQYSSELNVLINISIEGMERVWPSETLRQPLCLRVERKCGCGYVTDRGLSVHDP